MNSGIKLSVKSCGVGDFNFWKRLSSVFTLESLLVKTDMKSSRQNIYIYNNNVYSVFTAKIFINFLSAGSSPKCEFFLSCNFTKVLGNKTCNKVMLSPKSGSSLWIPGGSDSTWSFSSQNSGDSWAFPCAASPKKLHSY